jgi:hypothetical protein
MSRTYKYRFSPSAPAWRRLALLCYFSTWSRPTNQIALLNTVLLEKLTARSSIQEILRPLWRSKVHHRVHNSLPPVSILSQINSLHILQKYFSKNHFNIILLLAPRSFEWSLPFIMSSKQNSVRVYHLPMHATCPAQSSSLVWPSSHIAKSTMRCKPATKEAKCVLHGSTSHSSVGPVSWGNCQSAKRQRAGVGCVSHGNACYLLPTIVHRIFSRSCLI